MSCLETYKVIRLSDFIRGFFQTSLRGVDPTITLVDVFLHVPHVIILESVLGLVWRTFILALEWLAVNFWALTEVLFGIGEEIVRTSTDQERAADFWVGERQLGMSG